MGLFREPICINVQNFVPICRTFAEIWLIFDFSRWWPSAILDLFYVYLDHPRFVGLCHCAKFGRNRFSSFDNMPLLMFCEFKLAWRCLFTPLLGDLTPIWDTISTNLTKVSSTDHSGSSGILLMLVSVVVPEKLPWQKMCDEEADEEEEEEEEEH